MRHDAQPHPHCRYEGKRHGRTKKAIFNRYRQGQNHGSIPALAASNRVLQGFFPHNRPVLAQGQRLGVLRTPPATQGGPKSLFTPLRYDRNTKLSVFSSYRSSFFTRLFSEVKRWLTNSTPSCAT